MEYLDGVHFDLEEMFGNYLGDEDSGDDVDNDEDDDDDDDDDILLTSPDEEEDDEVDENRDEISVD